MKLSTKGRYAVMAMVDLARAQQRRARSRSPRSPSGRRSRCPISSSCSPSCAAAAWSRACAVRAAAICWRMTADETRISDIILAVDEPIQATRCTPGSADRLPQRPEPLSDARSVGGAGQPDPPLSQLGSLATCATGACSAPARADQPSVGPSRRRAEARSAVARRIAAVAQ